MAENIYDKLSKERKEHQEKGLLPPWYSTGGWQLFKSKYLYNADSWKEQVERICNTLARHTKDPEYWSGRFYELMYNGWLSPSTPVLSNTGTDRGLPVSCSGTYIEDSISGFFEGLTEVAVLTKNGFGTASYLGDIRHRGSLISTGGKSSGVLPVLKMYVQSTRDVSQGNVRRGQWAGYIEAEHGDFWEIAHYLEQHPDDLNIGWIITDNFTEGLNTGNQEYLKRYQMIMKIRSTLGRGYLHFIDKTNRKVPECYKKLQLKVRASQLCSEIMLHSSDQYTYTCTLSSMNVARYDEWKDTDAVFVSTVFLDCVVSEFLEKSEGIKHLEKAREFTRLSRPVGLGQMGLFSLFQKRRIDPESLQAHLLNIEVAKKIWEDSGKASEYLAKEFGEPEWCRGTGHRFSHRIAIAPTKSTSLLLGGFSEGINPDPAMAFSASGAAGDIDRLNPVLLDLIKEKSLDVGKCTKDIIEAYGSVQGVTWLNDEEKSWFKTAFEIDQNVLIRYASTRQKNFVDQGQSTNLFFSHDDTEEYISKVHKNAFLDENILSLYYVYSSSEIKATRNEGCVACE